MDLDKHSPSKSKLVSTFSRVFRVQSSAGISPDNDVKKKNLEKTKSDAVKKSAGISPDNDVKKKTLEKTKSDVVKKSAGISPDMDIQAKTPELMESDALKKPWVPPPSDNENDEQWDMAIKDACFAQLFASISTIKAAYAQLQYAQCPYDAEGIQSSDQLIVSELRNMSQIKQSCMKKETGMMPPEMALLLSEIQEQKSLLKIYEITGKKLDTQLKLKDIEIASLKEKLAESEKDDKSLEKMLNASGQFVESEKIQLSDLRPSHFITYFRQMLKSIRSFVRLLIREMEAAEWNLDSAASTIEPGVNFWKPSHKCYAFESFVCKKMFDGFNYPNFSPQSSVLNQEDICRQFFDRFMELKSVRSTDYLAWKPKSPFATFCRTKYSKLMHPKMEACLFGNMDIRKSVDSCNFPDTPFFSAFSEMAKRVWLLHCLALSFDPTVSIFQAGKGSQFSEVYMESLSDEAFLMSDGSPETEPRVAFTVFPGFTVGGMAIQCQVYLCCSS